MRWSFSKYTGCGNDFVIFDTRKNDFPLSSSLISTLCDRRKGIGADGILICEASSKADAKMRIFNLDGSEAEMCGNGLRCFVKWLSRGISNFSSCLIEVHQRLFAASQVKDDIRVDIGIPSNLAWNIPCVFENQVFTFHYIDPGVPHTLAFVDNVDSIDVQTWGARIRHSWQPKGTNVNFVQQLAPQRLRIRTYERGVEAETPACGTGAVASAIAAAHLYGCPSPIVIETASQEELIVDFCMDKGLITQVALTGPAHWLFDGEIEIPSG